VAVCVAGDEPEWRTEFRKIYGLSEGELVRRVAPPYAECRSEYFRDRVRRAYRRINKDFPEAEATRDYSDHFTRFAWKDGWSDGSLIMCRVSVDPNQGTPLGYVLQMVTGFNSAVRTASASCSVAR
jgi:hypothetical protein